MQGDSGFRDSGFRSPSVIDTDNQRSVSKVGIRGRLMPHVECKIMHSLVATFCAVAILLEYVLALGPWFAWLVWRKSAA